MTPSTAEALETAWYAQDLPTVERLARDALAAAPDEPEATGWLALALYVQDQVPRAQELLRGVFTAVRAAAGHEKDETARARHTWLLHGVANRLTDAVGDNPSLGPRAARFIVEELQLEHVPALRLLADEVASADPVAAANFLKRALTADPTDPESHYAMARALARLGKKPNVMKHLEAALKYGQGLLAVRTLARVEPDFDGFRADADFAALVETLPPQGPLRELYEALDRGEPFLVVPAAARVLPSLPNPLDALYPLKEALELLIDAGEGDVEALKRQLATVGADIAAAEQQGRASPVYARYCGTA